MHLSLWLCKVHLFSYRRGHISSERFKSELQFWSSYWSFFSASVFLSKHVLLWSRHLVYCAYIPDMCFLCLSCPNAYGFFPCHHLLASAIISRTAPALTIWGTAPWGQHWNWPPLPRAGGPGPDASHSLTAPPPGSTCLTLTANILFTADITACSLAFISWVPES